MSDTSSGSGRDVGPHQHAHVAPTTQQVRTVGQRRREAEEKLERHLQEARRKGEHHDGEDHPDTAGSAPAGPSAEAPRTATAE